MKKILTAKQYKRRSIVLKGIGNSLLLVSTLAGFFGYQAITQWEEFKASFSAENFLVVDPENVTLNPVIAFPLLIGLIVYIFVASKKNKEFFKGRTSIGIMITMAIIYIIYSVSIVTLATLGGALAGSLIDETIFTPLSNRAKLSFEREKEIEMEESKEYRRIEARRRVKERVEDIDGSV